MDEIRITKYIRSMYDVAKVKVGYDYWYFKILNILLDMFEWKNLPPGVKTRDIELNLLLTGHAVFIPREDGTVFVPVTSLAGFDAYYQPTMCAWANPVINNSKVWKLHEECEIIYNSTMQDYIFYIKSDNSMCSFIGKYARLLADIESTIDIYLVNSRLTSIPSTDDGNVAQSIKMFFKKLALGERAILTDSNIIQQFRNIDVNRTNINDGINDLLIARDKIFEMMFRDIGVKMNNPKKAQVNTEEIEANDQMLLLALDDFLKARKEGAESVNELLGTNMVPELNERFNPVSYSEDSEEPEEMKEQEVEENE